MTLENLRNIGPKSARQLREIGIENPAQLSALGTEEVFARLYFRFADEFRFTAVYLYALEGAILDCDWRAVPVERKEALKTYFQCLKSSA